MLTNQYLLLQKKVYEKSGRLTANQAAEIRNRKFAGRFRAIETVEALGLATYRDFVRLSI